MGYSAPTTIAESRCLVIGAASGIGLATAERLRSSGATVMGADLPSPTWPAGARTSSPASTLSPVGDVAVDVTDPASVAAAVSAAVLGMGCLLFTSPSPRHTSANLVCLLLLERKSVVNGAMGAESQLDLPCLSSASE
ncbi:SDR family oxidoreductase, partial [Paenarthrobacter nicotinovorans]|uniref:SDR family oxidoreductase n=1 Tax=Paenarthrobacter nicotinovorans TaxID=29320 RepID=UPI002485FEFE